MTRIQATDNEGRYLEPFLSFLVMSMDSKTTTDNLMREWGAVFVDGEFLKRPTKCAYLQFEDPEMATAFTLRWNGAAQEAINSGK